MRLRAATIVFLVPIAITLILAVVFSLSSLLAMIFFFSIGLPLAAIAALGSITLFVVYLTGRSSGRDPESLRLTGALAAGLAVSLVIALPAARASDWLVREARRPAREMLAERVISRAKQRGVEGRHELPLENFRALLSDGGTITVYVNDDGVSVWFWDVRGILDSYSASIYASDAGASTPPGGVGSDEAVRHESGHWWRPVPD